MNKPKLIIFAVAALIIISTLFIPPFYGKGDDGSFYQILTENGLYNTEGADIAFFNNVFGMTNTETENGFLPITIAKVLCGFVSTIVLDIRVLALLYLPFYLCGVYLILRKIQVKNKSLEIAVSIVAAIILCDIGYISYMNSFYKEALYLVFFLLFSGSLLNIKKDEGVLVPCAVLFILSAAVLSFMGAAGLIVAVLAAVMLIVANVFFKNISGQAIICGILASVISIGCFMVAPAAVDGEAQVYSRVFEGAVQAENAAVQLKELGLSEKHEEYVGLSYYNALGDEGVLPPALVEELKGVSRGDIFMFYLKNPANFIKTLTSAGKNAPFLSQSYIATEMNANYHIKMAPGLWSYARRFLTPGNLWILLAISLAVIVCVFVFFKKDAEIMVTAVTLAVSSVVFMINPVLKGGLSGISRNLIMHQVAFDVLLVVVIVCAVNMALERRENIKEKFGVNQ